jgi:hypothetical protein
MKTRDTVSLPEAVLLLALRDREGTLVGGTMYHFALGGAIAAELLLTGHLVVEPDGKRNYVKLASTRPPADPVLAEAHGIVRSAKRRKLVQSWVQKFAAIPRLKHRIAGDLCRAGILRADEDQVLWIFTRKIYPETNPVPERRLIEQIRKAILSDTSQIDPRTVVLIALAKTTGLLKVVLERSEIKARKERIETIVRGEVVSKAMKDAIAATQAMQAAIMTAVIVPAICAATH